MCRYVAFDRSIYLAHAVMIDDLTGLLDSSDSADKRQEDAKVFTWSKSIFLLQQ